MDFETLNTAKEINRYLETFPFYDLLLFEKEECDFYVGAHIPGMEKPTVFVLTPKGNGFVFQIRLADGEELEAVPPTTIAKYAAMANTRLENAILTLNPNCDVSFFQETASIGGPICGYEIHVGLVSSMKNSSKFVSGLMEIVRNHRDVAEALEDADAASKIVWAFEKKFRIDRSNLCQEQHDRETEDDELLPF